MAKRSATHMEAQRERIMRAAIACIADKGLDRTSVADIRRKAGVSTGTLYVHFKSKDDLISAALSYASFREGTAPETWRETLEILTSLDGQLGFDIKTVARTRLHLHAECALPGHMHDTFRPILQNILDFTSQQLEKFEARGEIRMRMSPAQTARALVGVVDGLLMIALETDRPLEDLRVDLVTAIDCMIETRS